MGDHGLGLGLLVRALQDEPESLALGDLLGEPVVVGAVGAANRSRASFACELTQPFPYESADLRLAETRAVERVRRAVGGLAHGRGSSSGTILRRPTDVLV